jgi:arginyl-tRNA synthetase
MGKAYDAHPELLERRKAALRSIEHGHPLDGEPDYAGIAADISIKIVRAHLATMARLDISYNLLAWESVIVRAGLWRRTFDVLRESGVLQQPTTGKLAGCWVLPFGDGQSLAEDAQSTDDEHTADKILVRSDGSATYTGKDIAYQLWKFGLADDPRIGVQFHFVLWGTQHDGTTLWTMLAPQDAAESHDQADPRRFGHAGRVITVIDVRQAYLQQLVYESLRRLGYAEQASHSTHLAYEVVALSARTAASLGLDTDDGRPFYAMSGRKGIEIKADDLINAAMAKMRESKPELTEKTAAILAAAAIRYFMVRFDVKQVIALDVEDVVRATGETGVYLQYALARAQSILRRLRETAATPSRNIKVLPQTLDRSEWELLLHLDAYPRMLADATVQLAPHVLAGYVFELATRFTDFYEHTPPILKEEDARVKAFRARLVQATAETLKNALTVLGFVPLERI